MNKQVELSKLQKDEEKLLLAKILDKLKIRDSKNRFANTDFLDLSQKRIVEETLVKRKEENYQFFGGFKQAERTMLVLFPNTYLEEKIYNQIMSALRVTLPKELSESYEHKTYLGAMMKLGVKREKIGDIIVRENRCRHNYFKRN